MKLLLLDIETSPLVVYAWGLWDQTISHNHIVEDGRTLCYAAKWYGSDDVIFDSEHRSGRDKMLRGVHALLSEADAVIHYNGKSFDIPTLNAEFLFNGMAPPAPYKQIDLYRVVKSELRVPSKKLDYIAKRLGREGKVEHRGMDMWKGCMAGDAKSWAEMETYNRGDIHELEAVYESLRPWIKTHPNHGLYDEPGLPVCPKCGSGHLQRRGYAHTPMSKFARYQCRACFGWSREALNELPKEDRQMIMRNV